MGKQISFIGYLLIYALGLSMIIPSLSYRIKQIDYTINARQALVTQVHGPIEKVSLSEVSGEDILGMILSALNGEYLIVVDGVTIDSTTNMETVDVRGVRGHTYKIQVDRDSYGNATKITANMM